MQIILVSRTKRVPKTFDLADRRLRYRLAATALAAVLALAGVGATVALAVASPRDRALAEITQLHQQVAKQNGQLVDVRKDAQRDIDALAAKLGQLQAQSTRLNALGERLAQMGKLDSNEFNFDEQPAVGGVEDANDSAYALPQALDTGIDQLASRFDSQQAQLSALQSLLLDAKIESNLKPTGMPAVAVRRSGRSAPIRKRWLRVVSARRPRATRVRRSVATTLAPAARARSSSIAMAS